MHKVHAHVLETRDAWDGEERRAVEGKSAEFGLATKRFRAIDLSCRACDACGAGAGCWAWIPGGGPHASVFTPNLRFWTDISKGKLKES